MTQFPSSTGASPLRQTSQDKQTNLCIKLSVIMIAIGIITIIGSSFILFGMPGISPLGYAGAKLAIGVGGLLVLIGFFIFSIKCNANAIDEDIHTSKDGDIHTSKVVTRPEKVPKENKLKFEDVPIAESFSISENIKTEINKNLDNVINCKAINGLKFYQSKQVYSEFTINKGVKSLSKKNNRAFTLDTVPNLIFKMNPTDNESILSRYQKMVDSQKVCQDYELNLLVITEFIIFNLKFKGKEYYIIAEKKLDVNTNENFQEQYFENNADSLNQAIKQLGQFISITKYSGVTWRNNPAINNSLDEKGNLKLALIDPTETSTTEIGLFGNPFTREGGLLGCCVNDSQITSVIEAQQKSELQTSQQKSELQTSQQKIAQAAESRKSELADNEKLKNYYLTNKISQGNEPLLVDIKSIDFSPYSPSKTEKLQKLAHDLVDAINQKIADSSLEEPIKIRRRILIDTNIDKNIDTNHDIKFQGLDNELLLEEGENGYKSVNSLPVEEYYNTTYLGFVVNKFIEMGLIYKVIRRDGHGYLIQA